MEIILIADEQCMVRLGLKSTLLGKFRSNQVFFADSCNSIMNSLRTMKVTHLIMEINFPDGTAVEIAPIIRKLYPNCRIMIFTALPLEIYAEPFRKLDISHFLNKSAEEMQTLRVLQNFLEQKSNVDMHLDEIRTLGNPFGRLTHRELEILGHLVSGIRNQEIALRLKVSDNTISTFKKRIFEKTGAKNIAQLIDLHHTFHSRSAM